LIPVLFIVISSASTHVLPTVEKRIFLFRFGDIFQFIDKNGSAFTPGKPFGGLTFNTLAPDESRSAQNIPGTPPGTIFAGVDAYPSQIGHSTLLFVVIFIIEPSGVKSIFPAPIPPKSCYA